MRGVGIFILIIAATQTGTDSYFGLTEKKVHLEQLDAISPNCKSLSLSKKQRRFCKKDPGMPETLFEAVRLSTAECQYQFFNERWNCTSGGGYRENVLKRGFKETSFLYAISSAGLAHSVARSCSRGILDRCTCDESFNDQTNRATWKWGGCGDNLKYSQKFVQNFLQLESTSRGQDLRAKAEKHNSEVGVRLLRQGFNTTCKCHGVSASCTTRTCWQQLSPFREIGNQLKEKYEKAYKVVSTTNESTGTSQLVTKSQKGKSRGATATDGEEPPPRPSDLVYVDNSPHFCKKSRFSPGTDGRRCLVGPNCNSICCGRGYNIKTKVVEKSCKCRVVWCCYVECDMCSESVEIHLCKNNPDN
ncbi:wingless-type MMTV integration site family, member 9 [Saccoglossus kowalevskii]|uniref:Protein Wnt n=1 Tax=Saccoglossus kowalevskii TaxID=10224 RepID=D1LXI6_SACKO|nr:wingless-type MMTV integration site family, member 9 [Saccoglossus kowalevskii]ACY92692.1 Wnt9 [Saccoglossus kowalevskii]